MWDSSIFILLKLELKNKIKLGVCKIRFYFWVMSRDNVSGTKSK